MYYEIKLMTEEEEDLLEEKLGEYLDTMASSEPCTPAGEKLVFKAEDAEGNVAGGCAVNIYAWRRAVLGMLWVDERHRKTGLGSMLIRQAEEAARGKGCYYLCLGTTDFQARGLYEKHGFRVFTVNKDIPKGHESWSLSKRLDRPMPEYIPVNNSAEQLYTIRPGTKEDAKIIENGLDLYCRQFVQDEHDYIELNRKLTDGEGTMIAGIIAGVDEDCTCDIDSIWVEEPYRKQRLGTHLLREAEREAKENGAYVVVTNACDWNVGFFLKNGYTVRGELEDYPKGHRAYELEKRI